MKQDVLLELLDSPDPAVRAQGLELGYALGASVGAGIFEACQLTSEGLLWHPRGLRPEHIALMLQQPAPWHKQIRHLIIPQLASPETLAKVAQLPALERLDLFGVQLSDISALRQMQGLQWLSLDGGAEQDLSALATLTRLETLSLNKVGFTNFDALQRLPNLRTLSLRRSWTTPGATICIPTGVRTLDIRNFQIRDERGTLILPAMTTSLSADYTQLPQLGDHTPTRLFFDMWGDVEGEPMDLSPLRRLSRLTWLDFSSRTQSRRADMEPLEQLPALAVVDAGLRAEAYLMERFRWRVSPRWVQTFPSAYGEHTRTRLRSRWMNAAHHWQSRGYSHQIRALERMTSKIYPVKAIRDRFPMGLLEAKLRIDRLFDDNDLRLGGLRLNEAIRTQATLWETIRTVVEPWDMATGSSVVRSR